MSYIWAVTIGGSLMIVTIYDFRQRRLFWKIHTYLFNWLTEVRKLKMATSADDFRNFRQAYDIGRYFWRKSFGGSSPPIPPPSPRERERAWAPPPLGLV